MWEAVVVREGSENAQESSECVPGSPASTMIGPNGVRDTPAWHPERETVSQSASQPASEAVIPLRRALPLRCRLPARFDAAGTTDGGSTRRCRHDAHQDIQSQIQWTLLVK